MQIYILKARGKETRFEKILGYYATEELAQAALEEERQMLIDIQLYPVYFQIDVVSVNQ